MAASRAVTSGAILRGVSAPSLPIDSGAIYLGGDHRLHLISDIGVDIAIGLGGEQTIPAAATISIDPTIGKLIRLTLSATAINAGGISISAGSKGDVIHLSVIQDTTARTLTQANFSSSFVFAGGTYTVTATANKRDILTFSWDSVANKWFEVSRAVNL